MALAGNIKEFGLADIFQIVSLQQKTGVLTVEKAKQKVTILLESGFIVGGDSSDRPLEERFEQTLAQGRQISKFQLKRAIESQKKTLQPLWTVLAETGEVSPDLLQKVLSQQIHETVYNVLRWTEGEYRFEPKKSVEYDKNLISPINTEFLVMEGFRITDEWSEIEKEIPSLHQSVQRTQTPATSADLSGDEAKVYDLLASKKTVQELIYMSQLGEFETCQVIYELLKKHLIEPVGGKKGRTSRKRSISLNVKDVFVKGITLVITLGILAGIIGLFMYLPDEFRLFHRPNLKFVENVKRLATEARASNIARVVSKYFLLTGKPPSGFDQLLQERLVSSQDVLYDHWGNPFTLDVQGKQAIVRSSGQDEQSGSEDDIQRVIVF